MAQKIPNINFTLKHDLCTGCGVCQGACPSKAIQIAAKNGNFRPVIDSSKCNNSKGCHRCYDICPGLGVNLVGLGKECFTDADVQYDKMCGQYLKCFTGHSNDEKIRLHSASGGMISQFLIWLLDHKIIDGAVVTRFDNANPLMVTSFIATTREEIYAARSSKYAPVSLNNAAQDIKNAEGSRYVIVGVPCHIQGFRKLAKIDKKLREKIVGYFGVYCSCGRTFDLTEFVLKERKINRSDLISFQYRDDGCLGYLKTILSSSTKNKKPFNEYAERNSEQEHIVYKEHFQSYYHPLRSFFIPRRCLFCIDHYAELADVSFGDIHIAPYIEDKIGVNSLIVRKQQWLDLLLQCKEEGAISLDEVPFKTISDSQRMSFKKKGRNGAFINICKKLGMVMPQYDVDYLRKPTRKDWIDFLQNRIQQFIGRHKCLWGLLSKIKAKVRIH